MIVLNCLYTFKSEDGGDMNEIYKKIYDAGLVEGSRKDHGNAGYDFFIAPDKQSMLLVEKWESAEDLQAHSETELFSTFRPLLKENGIRVKMDMYEA